MAHFKHVIPYFCETFHSGVCYDIESLNNPLVVPLSPYSSVCNDFRIRHTIDIVILMIMRTEGFKQGLMVRLVSLAALPYDSFIPLLTLHQLIVVV